MTQNTKLYIYTIVAALAGFLFGFDTVVISGAEQQLDSLWHSYNLFGNHKSFHGIIVVSSALWGTVIGATFASYPTRILGPKKTLLWIGILYVISSVGAAMTSDPWVFAFFRFLGGLGVGASTVAAPIYISEIAPAKNRGRLVATYQFNIVFGILIAFISNYLFKDVGENAWRWMIGIQVVPSLIYSFLVLLLPQSPRWLITEKGEINQAREIIKTLNPDEDADQIIQSVQKENASINTTDSIFDRKYRKVLWLAFFISFFNQFSGINAFLYYSKRIFEIAGLEQSAAFMSSIGVGLINLIFTMIGISLIDKYGRKQLIYIGSIGYIISLIIVALSLKFNWGGMVATVAFFAFIASHAIGQGSVIWVFISEIFPNHLRAAGTAFGCSVHWWLAAIIPSLTPIMIDKVGASTVFAFFAFMMLIQLLWSIFFMPETKGVSLEELSLKLKSS